MPVFENRGAKKKAMILSLTPASSTLLQKPLQQVFARRNWLSGPQKELGVIFPCEEDGVRSRIAREGREGVFAPKQDQTPQVSPGSPVPDLLGGLLLPAILPRGPAFETAILPMSLPKIEDSCER
ncbi:hypothetical protein GWK47_030117 [Chionoecetes opilio]|uniref:Uncharacterized protein n=1 Tax=Chionoecetes opilio TaxID=41210 RepID=A0A8J5D4V9_CHIOP|nr:hypothetical protein GWK47_030117 [Chionoecetes opilio]